MGAHLPQGFGVNVHHLQFCTLDTLVYKGLGELIGNNIWNASSKHRSSIWHGNLCKFMYETESDLHISKNGIIFLIFHTFMQA